MEQTHLRFLKNHPYTQCDRDRIVLIAKETGSETALALVTGLIEDAVHQDDRRKTLEWALALIGGIVKGVL